MKHVRLLVLVASTPLSFLVESFTPAPSRTCRPTPHRSVVLLRAQSNDDNGNDVPDNARSETTSSSTAPQPQHDDDKQDNDDDTKSLEEKMDDLLDRQFFDPKEVPEGSPLKWFANLVENDYATAEALYASFFIAGMVIVSQELVRMQYYGDNYVPFQKLGDGLLF